MALFQCVAFGLYNSGRPWSFRQKFSSSATLATVETDWQAAIVSLWTDGTHGLQTLYPTTTSLRGTRSYSMFLTLGPPIKVKASAVSETDATHAGTSSNDGMPDQDAIVVSLRTAGAGVNNRGRTFLPAMDETIVVGDILGTTEATRVTTAMTALRAAMAAAGHTQVLWNDRPTVHDPVTATLKPVTLCKTDQVVRSQRRRVRKLAAQYS